MKGHSKMEWQYSKVAASEKKLPVVNYNKADKQI